MDDATIILTSLLTLGLLASVVWNWQLRRRVGVLEQTKAALERAARDAGHVHARTVENERRLTELVDRLGLSQQRLTDAVDALPDAFVMFDSDDRLLLCNAKYSEIYRQSAEVLKPGFRFEDILRYGLRNIQYPEAIGREEAWIAERMARHRDPGEAIEQMLPDGRWIRIVERKTRDGGIVGFRVDITELKQREFEARAARDAAEKANEAKSAFLATMSHELRTPMNGVLGMTEVLLMSDMSDKQREYASHIKTAGEALLMLLNQILDLSKIEAGHLEIEEIDVDLDELLEAVKVLWREPMKQKGLTFTVDVGAEVSRTVRTDPTRLRQVLFNLVGNALKFTQEGGVTLAVSQRDMADDECELSFAVSDTGIGIEPGAVAAVFEKFTQADSTVTRRFGGTGLGLTISRQLVELLGGEISCTSTPGVGSTFRFTVPCRRVDAAPRRPSSPKNSAPAVAPSKKSAPVASPPRKSAPAAWPAEIAHLRYLIAEDNSLNQQLLLAMIGDNNARIDVVDNGLQAVEAMRRTEYDIVLMDIQMPEMDGVTACRQVRALSGRAAQTPIVALTANVMESDRDSYMAAGMNDHVGKPVHRAELIAAIVRCCGDGGAAAAAAAAG